MFPLPKMAIASCAFPSEYAKNIGTARAQRVDPQIDVRTYKQFPGSENMKTEHTFETPGPEPFQRDIGYNSHTRHSIQWKKTIRHGTHI